MARGNREINKPIMMPLDMVQKIWSLINVDTVDTSNYLLNGKDFYYEVFQLVTAKNDVYVRDLGISMSIDTMTSRIHFQMQYNSGGLKLSVPFEHIQLNDFHSFLLGGLTFWDFLCRTTKANHFRVEIPLKTGQIRDCLDSWNQYVVQLGYDDERRLLNFSDIEIKSALNDNRVVWYYGSSCSGKTYMGIRELKSINTGKVAYNPCFSFQHEYAFIKLILCYGQNITLLLDDIQCDTEKAEELFSLIADMKDTFKARNVRVFLISWVSLTTDSRFVGYKTIFSAIESNVNRYISQLQRSIPDSNLRKVCGSNLALLNIANTVATNKKISDPERTLFEAFVKTHDINKLNTIYKLCVLGSYEYLIPTDPVVEKITSIDMQTIKLVNDKYYIGHKEICRFLATYIFNHKEELGLSNLQTQDKIIYEYIQSLEAVNQWNAIKQLIGEHGVENLQDISPIWKGLHRFEQEISVQTSKDPAWGNAPSSMYFVLKVASLLGVVSEYRAVLDNFCNIFIVRGLEVEVRYSSIATTNDFEQIKRRMIEEDSGTAFSYELGEEFDCNRAHKNWLLGLAVGLKNELCQFGHKELYDAAVSELFVNQDELGYWYPKRVPWITARVLIGLSQAGFDSACDKVRKGVSFLFECLGENDHWDAHTGNWNTPYETSSLCLEAIYNSKFKIFGKKKMAVESVIHYLLINKEVWMKDDKVVDGSATACCLLKNNNCSLELIDYIQKLCEQRIYRIIAKNSELDLAEQQSCETTQVAWYIMDFCWDVLYTNLPDLLNQFLRRSLQGKSVIGGDAMKTIPTIFISYSEDSTSFVQRIQKVSAHLRRQGYIVKCYADEPIGTNMISFMQVAPKADLILIMGSKNYKEKSLSVGSYEGKGSGVFFENLIFSQLFIQHNMDRIIPIAFEKDASFEDSFPPPFATNKGMACKKVTDSFLENLSKQIEIKLGGK